MDKQRALITLLFSTVLTALPAEASIWDSLTPALERAASYGSYMLGYGPPPHAGYGLPPDVGYGLPPGVGYGISPDAGYGIPPDVGYGLPPDAGYGLPPDVGYGLPPDVGYGSSPHVGYGYGYQDGIDFPINPGTIWNGHIPVGDFVSPIIDALGAGQGGYADRVVKGYENRLGLRVALPYLGDFQVTRELGPGKFLDKLGPGKFPYPGLKGVRGQYKASSPDHHHDHHHKDHYHASTTAPPADMYNSLKNYPWHRKRR